MTAGCGTATSSYRLVDSGQAMGNPPGGGPAIVWLDDKRVLFVGLNKERPYGTLADQLMIWNTGTGAVETYKANGRGIYCYNPLSQEISYFTSSDQSVAIDVKFWFGRLGQERIAEEGRFLNMGPSTCENYQDGRDYPGELTGKRPIRLLEEHGYLWPSSMNTEVSIWNVPLQMFNPAGKKVTDLPIGHREANFITFYLFKQAYFIERSGISNASPGQGDVPTTLDTRETRIGWWVHPDGRVEVVEIPPRSKLYDGFEGPSGDRFLPTRVGTFIPHLDLDASMRGGYLVRGDGFIKIVDGWLTDAAVSPDGCRIAFKYEPDKIGGGKPAMLSLIDFCSASKQVF